MTSSHDPPVSAGHGPGAAFPGEAESGGLFVDYLRFLRRTRRWWFVVFGGMLVLVALLLYLTLADIPPPPDFLQ